MAIPPDIQAVIKLEYSVLLHGDKSTFFQSWAARLNCHWAKITKIVKDEKRTRKGQPKAQYRGWAKVVFQIKKRGPEGEPITTEDALALALKEGLIPPEAADVPIGTYDRIGREEGWSKTSNQCVRFQAEKPNDAHHFDASTAEYLYIAREIKTNGIITDYLIKTYKHKTDSGYKNKPTPADKLRAWRYGLVDDYSGRLIGRYVAARGEAGKDSLEFVCWAWSQFGLGKQLLCDQGSLKKHIPSKSLMGSLGIEFPEMMPYNSRGHGKIERPWRTISERFERPFFEAGEKFEIPLSEVNRQFMIFLDEKYNQMPHRWEREITRMQAWSKIALDGGMVRIPENILLLIAREDTRKVTIEGIVWLDNVAYEVVGLYDAWVKVCRSVFGNETRLVAVDIKTGLKYPMRGYQPLNLGEFKSFKDTPHQTLVKESESLPLAGVTLYSDKAPADEKIISMPIRTKEEREVADPFDVSAFASIDEAMREVMQIVITLDAENKEVVKELIIQNGLKKQYAIDLAMEIMAIRETKRAACG